MSYPLLSVLLPLYNEPLEFATLSIESICTQTYRNLEIILLLDNPQNMELWSLIESFAKKDVRICAVLNLRNMGLPMTLNKGIEMAGGDFIARMDGDDISLPERFEKQVGFLLSHLEVDLLGADAIAIDEKGNQIGYYSKLKTDFSLKVMLRNCSTSLIHPTWIGRKEVFKECKYRDFLRSQDYDFLLRAYALNFKFYNLKEPLLKYRISRESLRAISCRYAYEQYVNAMIAREQFREFQRTGVYPDLPCFEYDIDDKSKYLATIPFLNELRQSWFQHDFRKSISLFLTIWRMDKRSLKLRLKSAFFTFLLRFYEVVFH